VVRLSCASSLSTPPKTPIVDPERYRIRLDHQAMGSQKGNEVQRKEATSGNQATIATEWRRQCALLDATLSWGVDSQGELQKEMLPDRSTLESEDKMMCRRTSWSGEQINSTRLNLSAMADRSQGKQQDAHEKKIARSKAARVEMSL
jgi:hypothetical protein